ncbi:MAG: reprolysin-like metallopeptidase [Cocleimonas sp.]
MKSWTRFTVVFLVCGLSFGVNLGMFSSVHAESQTALWKKVENPQIEVQAKSLTDTSYSSDHSYENAQLMILNEDLMRSYLGVNNINDFTNTTDLSIGAKNTNISDQYQISLPLPNGKIIDLTLIKDSILPERLAAKYPDINTYKVLSNDLVFSGKVDITASGFHAMLQMFDGEVVFIDPVDLNKKQYAIFNKSAQKTESHRQHSCDVDHSLDNQSFLSSFNLSARETNLESSSAKNVVVGRTQESLKNYSIAVATTGEYSAKFGGSSEATMAAIATTINRVNQILERDLGIHLNLVENNDLLINTNASSDPFNNTTLLDLVFQNQAYIDAVIGNQNYDIGHLFTASGGGLAAVASICNNNNKAKGASGISSPKGDSFDLDFVAHEIGHQLGATHTFNSSQGACSSETRSPRTAFEPGSGTSIMSYAGSCGSDSIQTSTDAMYHIGSIKQIAEYTNIGTGSTCGVVTSSDNTPPLVDAGKNYSIPANTPFELTGSASDSDGDALLYAWEQLDVGVTSLQSSDMGNNALFRVHTPNSSKSRSFPPLMNVLNHTAAKGETLPKHQRALTMSFVAQDSFNVAQSDVMRIQVSRTGSRFAMNYPRAQYTRGNTYPIYWNVANTDKAPVNCSSVNVWLSTDGGYNFNQPVARNIPNTGETQITIPADSATSTNGRFKIKCSDNIFYAVSYRNFFITDSDDIVTPRFDDEDQIELNTEDRPLEREATQTSSDNSGGGVFNMLFCFLLLPFLKRFFRGKHRQRFMISYSKNG